jgi:hypothetical protein
MVETVNLPKIDPKEFARTRLFGFGSYSPYANGFVDMNDIMALAGLDTTNVEGYDVILAIGQSNNVGMGLPLDPVFDAADPRIVQFPDTGTGFDTAIAAQDPLRSRGGVANAGKIGNSMAAAKAYLATLGSLRKALIVPMAVGGSTFRGGDWNSGLAFSETYIVARDGGTAGNTITIDGHLITLVASGATGQQINVAAGASGLIANLRTYLVANTSALSFATSPVMLVNDQRADGSVESYSQIVLTQKVAGAAANTKTITQSASFSFTVGGEKDSGFVCGCNVGGGGLINEAIAQCNQALAYGGGVNRIAWIDWQQGESDASVRPERYELELAALIARFRGELVGASATTPFIIGGQVPEYIALSEQAARIDRAHKRMPARVPYVSFAPSPIGSNSIAFGESIFHHDAPTQRALGAAKASLLPVAKRQGLIGAPGIFGIEGCPGSALGTATIKYSLPTTGSTRVTRLDMRYRRASEMWSTITIPNSATSWTLRGLDLGALYEFQVRGTNEQGDGGWSAIVTVKTAPVPYLLDNLVLAASASFSLRKLRALYMGSCVRVRRASDNSEMDISFNSSGLLDTATLLAFCSGTDGFVKTWYDQSGANNATQLVAAQQPRLVLAGSVVINNVLPAIDFWNNGSTAVHLEGVAGYPVAADVTMQAVVHEATGSGNNNLIGPNAGGNHSLLLAHQPALYVGGLLATGPVSAPAGTLSIGGSYIAATKTGRVFQNGLFQATGTNATATVGAGFQLGTYSSGYGNQLQGKMMEALILPSALSDLQMAALAAANAAHWGAGS